ncbi:sporulation protein [Paenibacillus sp. MMO-58]|uniref:sporulation protein n=1 Tax=Paenibacillus sp. MMO-58 TaxID=3081290 RepID=UPI0030196457
MNQIGSYIVPLLIILFVVYRRLKRSVGFQPFKPSRLKMRIGIFSIIGILLLASGFPHPAIYISDAIGIACGAVIAYYAIKHSRFEQREDTLFYRTHVGIETLVVLLFIGRIAFRIIEMFGTGGTTAMNPAALNNETAQMQQYTNDPLTAATFFLLVAYYIGYYTFILRKSDEKAAVS